MMSERFRALVELRHALCLRRHGAEQAREQAAGKFHARHLRLLARDQLSALNKGEFSVWVNSEAT